MANWFVNLFEKNSGTPSRLSVGKNHKNNQKRASMSYSPTLIDVLMSDHGELLILFGNIEELLIAQRYDEIPVAMGEFKTKLDVHLLTENVQFYGYLEQTLVECPENLEIMKGFRREMSEIARTVIDFIRKWQTANISDDTCSDFLKEYRQVRAALTQRIDREENGLYTLYMK
ncbi:MAG: hypothetical protein NVSMB40_19130 [Aquirhabdus sp.]